MKNVTYLFGAGASANAVPVQNELEETVRECSKMVSEFQDDGNWHLADVPSKQQVKREFIDELNWLANQIKNNGTPDVFAENLERQKNFQELRRLKIIYSAFLVLVQCSRPTEHRYIRFLNRVMDRSSNQIKPNVKVLSWNYDFQLERGFSDVSHGSLWQLQKNYGFYQSNDHDSVENSSASIFNLNGTASFYNSGLTEYSNKYEFDFHSSSIDTNNFEIFLKNFGTIFHDSNFRPHLSFSWENNLILNKAIEKIKDTNALIVVGYSFPDENRTIDSKIISAMSSLTEVHIQDGNAYDLKRKLIELYLVDQSYLNPESIFERTNVNAFHIPNDLY